MMYPDIRGTAVIVKVWKNPKNANAVPTIDFYVPRIY